jgi:aryl-alcohol dehydrogenase-like predicted oxidoreductase
VQGFDPELLDANDFRRRMPCASEPHRSRIKVLISELARFGTPHEVALAYVLRHPNTFAIVGARTPAEATQLGSVPRIGSDELDAVESAIRRATPGP